MQLPSIDKTQRNPVKPAGEQVRKIQNTEQAHPRDYAYEMDKILEKEHHHHPQHPREFGEDTFEHSEESEQQSPEREPETEPEPGTKSEKKDSPRDTNDEQNIDIQI